MISEQDLQTILLATPVALLLLDREGRVLMTNPAASVLLGQPQSQLEGTPILRWIDEEDRSRAKQYFVQALQGRRAEWLAKVVRSNGSVRGAQLRVVPLADEEGAGRLVVYAQETEIEGDDRTLALQLLSLVQNLPGRLVVLLDTDGRIRFSGGVARTTWQADEPQQGQEFSSLLSDREEARALFEEMLGETNDGRPWNGLLWLRCGDGSTIPVQIYAVPFRGARTNSIMGTILLGEDASLEHETRSTFERAKRFSAVGQLVVGIALELGKPLSRLDTLVTQMQELAGEPTGREAQLGVEVAKLNRLLTKLTTFTREPVISPQQLPLERVVEEAIAEQKYLIAEAGITLSTSYAAELPAITLDPRQIVIVLRNLLENAREALAGVPEGRIVIDAAHTAWGITIKISDNAPRSGVDWLEHGFNPFYTTKSEHLGLGLPLARGIVAEHGGQIWVQREDEGWTTVTVQLPLEPPGSEVVFRSVPLAQGRARPVLVVDGDPAVRSVLRKFLTRIDYRVTEAWSGRSALAQLTSGTPPELIITSLRLRDGTGHWLLERIAADFPEIARRTVIVTGDPAVDQIAAMTGCPVLRKPVDFQLLLETLDEVAARG